MTALRLPTRLVSPKSDRVKFDISTILIEFPLFLANVLTGAELALPWPAVTASALK